MVSFIACVVIVAVLSSAPLSLISITTQLITVAMVAKNVLVHKPNTAYGDIGGKYWYTSNRRCKVYDFCFMLSLILMQSLRMIVSSNVLRDFFTFFHKLSPELISLQNLNRIIAAEVVHPKALKTFNIPETESLRPRIETTLKNTTTKLTTILMKNIAINPCMALFAARMMFSNFNPISKVSSNVLGIHLCLRAFEEGSEALLAL